MAQEREYASRLARHRAGPEAATQVTLGTQVYGVLREFLIEGAFQPGEKLSLRSLAEALEVSVQPVRDAVARLIRDGALEVAPNRAVRVPLMTAPQFIELTAIRLAIEGFAVETAARAHSATDLQKIRRFDRAFRRQCKAARPDPERAVQANQGLHFSIYHAARMPALMPIIEGLWLRIEPDPEPRHEGQPAAASDRGCGSLPRCPGGGTGTVRRHGARGAGGRYPDGRRLHPGARRLLRRRGLDVRSAMNPENAAFTPNRIASKESMWTWK